jgi:hypothetical protein
LRVEVVAIIVEIDHESDFLVLAFFSLDTEGGESLAEFGGLFVA